jgi:hypothetical protein
LKPQPLKPGHALLEGPRLDKQLGPEADLVVKRKPVVAKDLQMPPRESASECKGA